MNETFSKLEVESRQRTTRANHRQTKDFRSAVLFYDGAAGQFSALAAAYFPPHENQFLPKRPDVELYSK
ncbi:hypothetical protein [Treponema sp. Marseille-Q4130]|uniref:hypothetical protein n=1 Tax=Treponema sp. Marseille-Q4130 TaxID=2766702 RepID=UPI00165291F9|nr:hypothetical protein [Treponema sp. Marseille-Q4130]MBC6721114.1 hypothetical protein [Treponema sp. Marseille-Q4130]